MKKIDIDNLQRKRYETYEKEKEQLIVTKAEKGYTVNNIKKASTYNVDKDIETGIIYCTCKDFNNYREYQLKCKHIIAVLKKAPRVNKSAIKTQINIIKEENIMNNNNKFNPQNHLMKVKGKDYLEVKYRVHWFRQEKPDWDIQTKIIQVDIEKGIAIAQADIFDAQGRHRSSGIQMEEKRTFPDYLAKAETASIGRALACLGYGTLQCFDMEEGIEKGRIVDAPVSVPVSHKAPAAPTYRVKSLKGIKFPIEKMKYLN